MWQEAARRLLNRSYHFQVRKVASLLAQPLKCLRLSIIFRRLSSTICSIVSVTGCSRATTQTVSVLGRSARNMRLVPILNLPGQFGRVAAVASAVVNTTLNCVRCPSGAGGTHSIFTLRMSCISSGCGGIVTSEEGTIISKATVSPGTASAGRSHLSNARSWPGSTKTKPGPWYAARHSPDPCRLTLVAIATFREATYTSLWLVQSRHTALLGPSGFPTANRTFALRTGLELPGADT